MTNGIEPTQINSAISIRARAGAAGKALIVYLGSGSILLAGIAYLVFTSIGC